MFAIRWNIDWDELTIDLHDGGLWLYITRSNRYTNGSVTVPLDFTPMETIGL